MASRIPPEFIDECRRLKWSFIIDDNGTIRPHILKMMPDIDKQEAHHAFSAILGEYFPHKVEIEIQSHGSEFTDRMSEIREWMATNCKASWQLSLRQSKTSPLVTPFVFLFENETDAVYFKMAWT